MKYTVNDCEVLEFDKHYDPQRGNLLIILNAPVGEVWFDNPAKFVRITENSIGGGSSQTPITQRRALAA